MTAMVTETERRGSCEEPLALLAVTTLNGRPLAVLAYKDDGDGDRAMGPLDPNALASLSTEQVEGLRLRLREDDGLENLQLEAMPMSHAIRLILDQLDEARLSVV